MESFGKIKCYNYVCVCEFVSSKLCLLLLYVMTIVPHHLLPHLSEPSLITCLNGRYNQLINTRTPRLWNC